MDEASASSYNKQHNRDALNTKIEFYKHNLSDSDKSEVLSVLNSLFLTTGETVQLFEKKFARYMDSKYVVGLMSCTHALELSLRYYGIGLGDEVITTPMSFIATANAIEYVGAKPVFVDVEETTGNINAELIEQAITPKTKALLVVHLYGQMCDMITIKKIADKYNLKIIEDCAHCIEGMRDGIRPGQLGDIACYSFYATKNLTCGEGGAITCNDEDIYEWMLKARQHGMTKNAADRYSKRYEHYDMEFLGMKCNMSNIQAALLIHQVDRLDTFLKIKERVAQKYDNAFDLCQAIQRPSVLDNSRHARHLYTIWVDVNKRDEYIHELQTHNIGVAVNFRLIHLMKYYRMKYGYLVGSFPVAEKIGASTITIPFYQKLRSNDIEKIISCIKFIL